MDLPFFNPADLALEYPGSPTQVISTSSMLRYMNGDNISLPSTAIPSPISHISHHGDTRSTWRLEADPDDFPNDSLGSPTEAISSSLPPTTIPSPAECVYPDDTTAALLCPAGPAPPPNNTAGPAPPDNAANTLLIPPPPNIQNATKPLKQCKVSEPEPIRRVVFAEFVATNTIARQLLGLVYLQRCQETSAENSLVEYDPDRHLYRLAVSSIADKQMWTIGASPGSIILLCPDGIGAADAREVIADNHASIGFHPGSGVLLIQSRSTRRIFCNGAIHIIKGRSRDEGEYSSAYAICTRRCPLVFGPYHFELRFVDLSLAMYEEFCISRDTDVGLLPNSLPFRYLEPIPSTPTIEGMELSRDIILCNRMSSSMWSGIVVTTGAALAIKTVKHMGKNKQGDVLKLLEQGLLPGTADIIKMIWEEQRPFREVRVVMPMATFNLRVFLGHRSDPSHIASHQILGYLYQTLTGLYAFHKNGIIHGNITPNTLLIYSDTAEGIQEYKALISPIIACSLTDILQPSIFIAPEVSDTYGSCSTKSDVWSLAMSWISCITGFLRIPVNSASQQDVEDALTMLINDGRFEDSFIILVRKMLAHDPRDRLASSQVASDDVWLEWSPRGGKRKEAHQEPSTGSGAQQRVQDANRAGKRRRTTRPTKTWCQQRKDCSGDERVEVACAIRKGYGLPPSGSTC